MSRVAISVNNLRKSYQDTEVVKGIDLSIAEGEVFALLGPNGAGKTTTAEILEGYRQRDGGDVSVLGFDPANGQASFKAQIGIVLQTTGVDPYLSVVEAIELYRGMYPHPRPLDEVIDLVELNEKRNTKIKKLSGGQRRRLDVAVALAGDPKVLFLDEPTEGFDPSARRNAWTVIKNLSTLGKTIFLTTHYMDEAEYLADRVAIIANGTILTEGPPQTLASRRNAPSTIKFLAPKGNLSLPKGFGAVKKHDNFISLNSKDPTTLLNELTSWAIQHDIKLDSLEVTQPSLEDTYLEIVQKARSQK